MSSTLGTPFLFELIFFNLEKNDLALLKKIVEMSNNEWWWALIAVVAGRSVESKAVAAKRLIDCLCDSNNNNNVNLRLFLVLLLILNLKTLMF